MARNSRGENDREWEDAALWSDFHHRDLSNEAAFMQALAELRARAGISYLQLSYQWKKTTTGPCGAEPPLSKARIHDLFRQRRLPRTREQLEQLLVVLITANKFRPQESTAYEVLLKRGLALLQERAHR